MRSLLFFSFTIVFTSLQAQTIVIKQVQLAGEKVIVHYDLDDGNPNNEYLLNLFSSKDNFTAPLSKVKGDIGAEVKPGLNKKIEWSIREEYGGYKGKIALEIRGRVYVPFVKLTNFDLTKSYKRGKSYPLTWKVGGTNPIHVELFKGSQRVQGDNNHPNNGSYTLTIPSGAKPGDDYRLKFTDSRDSEEVIYTSYFKVTPKIPTLVKIGVPVLIAGVAVAVLAGGGGGDPEGKSNSLPNPPTQN